MRRLSVRQFFSGIRIKWKLTLGSALLLFLLFAAYNVIQYFFIERWMIQQEKEGMKRIMSESLNFFLERETGFEENELPPIRDFLNKAVQNNQFIRVVGKDGSHIVAVSGGVPEERVQPRQVSAPEWTYDHESSLLILRSPLTILQFRGTVELVSRVDSFEKLTAAFSRVMVGFGVGALAISLLGGGLLAWRLLKPLQTMAATIVRIREKGLHERMRHNGREDELARLMRLFNEMMDQVEGAFQQQNRFVEDASHELRTPIAIMEGHLALLRRWGKSDPALLEESLEIAFHALRRLKGLVDELLILSQAEDDGFPEAEGESRPAETVASILKQIAVLHGAARFRADLEELAAVSLDIPETRLEQILHILLDNAIKYSPEGGEILVAGRNLGGQAALQISDRGIGIPPEHVSLVTDRFYRVDPARNGERAGYGLGLSIARRLTEKYGGSLSIRSELGRGTTVTLLLPALRKGDEAR